MWLRILILSLCLSITGCSGSMFSGGDVRATGKKCLNEADSWLAKPQDKNQLARALKTSQSARDSFEKDDKARADVVYGDIDLLYGALNMAQMVVDEGSDPTRPSSMSEVPVVASVRMVANQMREHLAVTPTPKPTP